jgi:hypothetical protein
VICEEFKKLVGRASENEKAPELAVSENTDIAPSVPRIQLPVLEIAPKDRPSEDKSELARLNTNVPVIVAPSATEPMLLEVMVPVNW